VTSPRNWRRHCLTLVGLAVLVALAIPAPASASTARVVSGNPFFSGSFFFYDADPGESNQVEASIVVAGTVGTITIRDTGASIVPGDGCTSIDAHEVTCSITLADGLDITLGDLDDTLMLTGDPLGWHVEGGGGADTLVSSCAGHCGSLFGGPGPDTLQGRSASMGGPGEDVLTGSPRRDSIAGGLGDDTLQGAGGNDDLAPGPGDDLVDGGPGIDQIGFSIHPVSGVTADLRTGVANGDGTDTFTAVEGFVGSEENDRLFGDGMANRLDGEGGDDVLVGRGGDDFLKGDCCERGGGDDHLYGGRGRDFLAGSFGNDFLRGGMNADQMHGQKGDDRLRAEDGFRDRLFGGDGFDKARADRDLDIVREVERIFF